MQTKDIKVGGEYAFTDTYSSPRRVRVTATGQARQVYRSGSWRPSTSAVANGVHYVELDDDGNVRTKPIFSYVKDTVVDANTMQEREVGEAKRVQTGSEEITGETTPAKITATWEEHVVAAAKVAERVAEKAAVKADYITRNNDARATLKSLLTDLGVENTHGIEEAMSYDRRNVVGVKMSVTTVEAINDLLATLG